MGGVAAPQRRPSLPYPLGAWSWLVPWSTALLQTNCAPPAWLLPSIWAAGTKSANRKTENPNKPHGFLRLRPETALRFLPSNVCRGARNALILPTLPLDTRRSPPGVPFLLCFRQPLVRSRRPRSLLSRPAPR